MEALAARLAAVTADRREAAAAEATCRSALSDLHAAANAAQLARRDALADAAERRRQAVIAAEAAVAATRATARAAQREAVVAAAVDERARCGAAVAEAVEAADRAVVAVEAETRVKLHMVRGARACPRWVRAHTTTVSMSLKRQPSCGTHAAAQHCCGVRTAVYIMSVSRCRMHCSGA